MRSPATLASAASPASPPTGSACCSRGSAAVATTISISWTSRRAPTSCSPNTSRQPCSRVRSARRPHHVHWFHKDRDLFAFYRIQIGADGKPGTWELLAERADAGSTASAWTIARRSRADVERRRPHELELLDLRTRTRTSGSRCPSELSAAGRSPRGSKLAMTISGQQRRGSGCSTLTRTLDR